MMKVENVSYRLLLWQKLVNAFISFLAVSVFAQLGWVEFPTENPINVIATFGLMTILLEISLFDVVLRSIFKTIESGRLILYGIFTLIYGWLFIYGFGLTTDWFIIKVPFLWQGLVMVVSFGVLRAPNVDFNKEED